MLKAPNIWVFFIERRILYQGFVWQASFLAKFVCFKFSNNFSYSNLKKFIKIFKLYTLKYSKKNSTTFTVSYNKILDKQSKNSLTKLARI